MEEIIDEMSKRYVVIGKFNVSPEITIYVTSGKYDYKTHYFIGNEQSVKEISEKEFYDLRNKHYRNLNKRRKIEKGIMGFFKNLKSKMNQKEERKKGEVDSTSNVDYDSKDHETEKESLYPDEIIDISGEVVANQKDILEAERAERIKKAIEAAVAISNIQVNLKNSKKFEDGFTLSQKNPTSSRKNEKIDALIDLKESLVGVIQEEKEQKGK